MFNENIIETKKCRITGEEFAITEGDKALYEKCGLSFPTLCPSEIWRNLLGYRNEWNLYSRKCSKTGENMLSQFRPDALFPVYNYKLWWSDDWNALDFGRDFDFSQPFFDQYKSLQDVVPRIGTTIFNSENCDYNSQCRSSRNCYLCGLVSKAEGAYYSYWTNEGKNVFNSSMTNYCENIYDCLDTTRCHFCVSCQECSDSQECFFSYQLKNCQNCIACSGLVGKQYYVYNKPATKEEYEKTLKLIRSNQDIWNKAKSVFEKIKGDSPRPATQSLKIENSIGDHIQNCRDCVDCFDTLNGENLRHVASCVGGAKDSIWCYSLGFPAAELCAYGSTVLDSQNVKWSFYTFSGKDIVYSDNCHNSSDLFGCIGIKRGQYAILNKPYSQQEYSTLKSKVIDHMKSTGEWGEFFPLKYSPYPYDDTAAQDWYPLTQSEVQKREGRWGGDIEIQGGKYSEGRKSSATTTEILHVSQYDEKIVGLEVAKKNIDHILTTVFKCPITGKPFQIIRQELLFHIENGIPLPTTHPRQRTRELMKLRNPRVLHTKECSDCGKMISTSYVPGGTERILCEECWQKVMY